MVGRHGEDDLCWASIETSVRLLLLDSAEESVNIGQHDTMSEFRSRVDGVNLTAILRDSRKWNNIIQIPTKTRLSVVNVVNQCLNILFRACC
jgi:hypothetical protein